MIAGTLRPIRLEPQGTSAMHRTHLPKLSLTRLVLAAAAFTAPFGEPARAADGPHRPNVLFLFSDDQRADTLAALGNKYIQTPNLDRLVQQGTVCTRAYCMGARQGAVCVPSRAMVMSGRTLFRAATDLKGQATWPE